MKIALPKVFSRLGLRLMLFNCLLVFLPLAALLVLDVFESQMLELQENTMASQARVLASSLGASLDNPVRGQAIGLTALASGSLRRLDGKTSTRLRVLDTQGIILADSSLLRRNPALVPEPSTGESYRSLPPSPKPAAKDDFSSLVYRLGSLPFRLWRALNPPPAVPDEGDDNFATTRNPAVLKALAGRYGAYSRVSSGQRSVTMYAAIPVLYLDGRQAGVVLASQSTWRTLQSIYEIRRSLFQIFLVSLVLALALSFLLSLTISRPLRRMRDMAEGFIDQWGRPTGSFHAVGGSDELAALSRSLVRLGDGLSDHVHFIESFAADLAHELRNPLASIRAAGELLGMDQSGETARLAAIIRSETERIDRLVALSRDLSKLDVAVGRSPRLPVDCGAVLTDLWQAWRLRGFEPSLEPSFRNLALAGRTVLADADFLRQAIDKLVENALDFSPQADSVVLSLRSKPECIEICVADAGAGVSDSQKSEIFRRFHTERRDAGHTGLGLSLAKGIVEAFGGELSVGDREGGGSIFCIKLPKA